MHCLRGCRADGAALPSLLFHPAYRGERGRVDIRTGGRRQNLGRR